MSFNNVAIVYVKGSACRVHFWYISKGDAINIMNGSNLVDKRDVLFIYLFILLYIKNEWECWFNLLSKTLRRILNREKDYYENNKERLREQARDKYRNLFEEKKIKRENFRPTEINA